jgi:salicylate hydroxylase
MGKDAHIVAYPIANGKMVNAAAFMCRHDLEGAPYGDQWVTTVEKDEFVDQFSHWEPEVQSLISCVDTALKWAIHTVKPLRFFVSGRVALLGDAAHAQQPTQGAGAGQAIEDAYFLATLLGQSHTTAQNVFQALSVYDSIRRPFSADVAERSRRNAQCFTMYHPAVADMQRCGEQEVTHRLLQMAEIVRKNWQWVWSTTIEASLEEAIRMLEATHGER